MRHRRLTVMTAERRVVVVAARRTASPTPVAHAIGEVEEDLDCQTAPMRS
jgi:hypothetical protein